MKSEPQYELHIEKRPLYLYACVQSDTIDRKMVLAYLNEILAAFRGGQYSRLLLVKEIPAALDLDDFGVIASEIVQTGAQGIKIAVVDEFPDHVKVNIKGAVRARKTGLDVEFFSSFAAAVHWLLYG
ncbi:MAG: hypothetical protein ABIV21_02770 [Pyrinomonadaceae bacterium]